MNEAGIEDAVRELGLGGWRLTPTPVDEQAGWGLWTIEPEEGGYRISASTIDEVWDFWAMCYREHLVAAQSTELVLMLHGRDEGGMARLIEEWAFGVDPTPPPAVYEALRTARRGFRSPGPFWRQEVVLLGCLPRPDEHDLRTLVARALSGILRQRLDAHLADGPTAGIARRL
jgi:hypothetical protein